ncbi:MAG: M55 family metallopeptidase [Spirochaetes bacterium]|nr:M55 family metallopeptidase [Spirochaetota bacterium]MBU1081159.1 M55 family metallopeptidase [Spirochaetota bacterium]
MEKLYVSADIEGVCGIADWKETEIGEAQGAYFRTEMTREVAVACEAAVGRGVTDILVKDAHGSGRSIDPSALPRQARILRSWTRDPFVMMAGLDRSFGGVFFVGYHSAAGTDGNPLAHTMNGNNVAVRINGELASEFLINSYIAGHVGVPVLMLAGDAALCATAASVNPNIRTVAVSEGNGNASVSIHPALAQERIAAAASEALSADPKDMMVRMPPSFKVSIYFKQHWLANRGSYYPGASRPSAHEVAFESKDWAAVLAFLFFVL